MDRLPVLPCEVNVDRSIFVVAPNLFAADKTSARQQGLGRARYWRALGWPNLQRAWARRSELAAKRRRAKEQGPEASLPITDLLRRPGD
jgi:hypothetical protein